MSKVSAKRQITLPIDQCRVLNIKPGDEVESFVAGGQLTLVKKVSGAAKGILEQRQQNRSMSDEESRQSAIE